MKLRFARSPFLALVILAILLAEAAVALVPLTAHAMVEPGLGGADAAAGAAAGHLVISELATGGASASDEFIELYNPTAAALPTEGLELIYVTASGATITRKAAWNAGAAPVAAHSHLLVANDAGVFAAVADATYATGLAAAGGSVALRVQAATIAIDAVGWGTAASTWLEGTPAAAPAAGSSLERLPGGAAGSGQDTDDNLVDFAVQPIPGPQNAAAAPIEASPSPTASETPSFTPTPTEAASATPSPIPATSTPTPTASPSGSASPTLPVTPSPTPTPAPTTTPSPTPAATSTPRPTPSAGPISILDARALPDGAAATLAGVALMDAAFVDGGGCVADGTAGIAVLVTGASFARGDRLLVSGTVDDRYAQRTLRADGADLFSQGTAGEPPPMLTATGSVGEAVECRLIETSGVIQGTPSSLSSGLAFDVDDGGGATRVLVAPAAAIDTSGWTTGATVHLVGVVGQRDSSGTGTEGYRVMPRDADDVVSVAPPATPSPSASPTPTTRPSASASPSPSAPAQPPLVTIAAARASAPGTRLRARGVVTLGTGLVDQPTAVIQDPSGAIVLRLGDSAGSLRRGALVEVTGVRSTKSGMLTLRVDDPPIALGSQAEPAALRVSTAAAAEPYEAQLLVARGAMTTAAEKSTAGNVAFSIDDGSGPLRVTIFTGSGIATGALEKGSWLEITGVLGQQTTGSQPDRGYRLWPRSGGDVRLVAGAGVSATGAGIRPPKAAPDVPAQRTGTSAVGASSALGAAPGLTTDAGEVIDPSAAPSTSGRIVDTILASSSDRRSAVGALLLALAALVMLSVVAWRTGTFDRALVAFASIFSAGATVEGGPPAS